MIDQKDRGPATVLVVDDDASVLEMISTCLRGDGYHVVAAGDARSALDSAERSHPDLVISDILMPDVDGFQFMGEYTRRFPHHLTPFIFLSSLSDRYSMVLGLDLGADDFLVKPVHLEVLKAKVRSLLQKKTRYTTPTFHGDLSKFSCLKLLQFCNRKGLTGEVVISSPVIHTRLQYKGGTAILPQTDDACAYVARLYELTEGTFVIHAQSVDFKEIEQAALPSASSADLPASSRPMGRLSAVRAEQRLFQIQTEYSGQQQGQIVTTVIVDGRVVHSRTGQPPRGTERKAIEKFIDTQHRAIEAEVRERISGDTIRRARELETSKETFSRLFDAGCEMYRERDYSGALALWSEAASIDPEDKTLVTNLKIVRLKLEELQAGKA